MVLRVVVNLSSNHWDPSVGTLTHWIRNKRQRTNAKERSNSRPKGSRETQPTTISNLTQLNFECELWMKTSADTKALCMYNIGQHWNRSPLDINTGTAAIRVIYSSECSDPTSGRHLICLHIFICFSWKWSGGDIYLNWNV